MTETIDTDTFGPQDAPRSERVLFTGQAAYRDPDNKVTLAGRVFNDGIRIGCQALEPWYGTGVRIPRGHPAYPAALAFLAALADAERKEGSN